MKTAEEILERHCGKINVPFDKYACEYHVAIIDAMQEFAAQSSATDKAIIEKMEMLIVCYKNVAHGHLAYNSDIKRIEAELQALKDK